MAKLQVNIRNSSGEKVDTVPMGYNGITGHVINNESQKVFQTTDEKGNKGYTADPFASDASITLDKNTGAINIAAPQQVLDDPSFSKIFNTDVLKQFSSAYQRNQDYKVPDPFDEGNEAKDITIPELVDKYNQELKNFVSAVSQENTSRGQIARGEQGFSNRNDIANRLTRDDFIIMGTNALGEGANDDSLISIPKSMFADVNFLESFDDVAGTVKKGDFRKNVFSLIEKDENYVNSLYNRLEEYFEEDAFEDTEEYARATALYSFLLNNDPDMTPGQVANYVTSNSIKGFALGFSQTVSEAFDSFMSLFSPASAEEMMDTGSSQFYRERDEEAEKFLSRMSTAGSTAYGVGSTIGSLGATIGTAVAGGGAAGNVARAATAVKSIDTAAKTAKNTEKIAASIAATAEDLTVGADMLLAANSTAKAAEIASAAARVSKAAGVAGTAADLAAQTVIEAAVYDPVVFAKVLQNQEANGQQAATDGDAYGLLLETAAWNIGGWGAFTVGAKGVKSFSKTKAGRYTNAVAQKYLNKVSVKTGSIGEKLLKLRYGDDYLSGAKSADVNQARRYNYNLRRAQEMVASQKIGAPFSKQAAANVRKQEENIIKLMEVHNSTDALQRGSNAYIRRMLDGNINPTLAGYEQKLRALGGKITKAERKAGLSTRRKVFRTKDNDVARVFSKPSSNYLGARTQLDTLANIKKVRGSLTEAQQKGKDILEKKLAAAKKVLPKEIQEGLEAYLAWDRKFYREYNNIRMREGSLNTKQIEELRAEGYWGENGELYRPSYRVDPNKETRLVRNDDRIARDNDTATEQYVWGSDKDFMDPEIARYMYMGDAGSTLNSTKYVEAMSAIPSTKAHVVYDAEEVARAQRMKDIRTPLGKRIKSATKGIFKDPNSAIASGESAKRASRLYNMRANWIKQAGKTTDAELKLARAATNKIKTTVTDRRTAIGAMDQAQLDDIFTEGGITFDFNKMASSDEFTEFYNSLDKTTQKYLQQKMGDAAGDLYPAGDIDVGLFRPAAEERSRVARENSNRLEEASRESATDPLTVDTVNKTNNPDFINEWVEQGKIVPEVADSGTRWDEYILVPEKMTASDRDMLRTYLQGETGDEIDLIEETISEQQQRLTDQFPISRQSGSTPLVKDAPYITFDNYNKLAELDPSFVPELKKALAQNQKSLRDSNAVTKVAEDAKRTQLTAEREGLYRDNLAELNKMTKEGLNTKDEEAILKEFDEGIDEYLDEVYSDKKLSQTIDDIIDQSGTVDKEAAREYLVLEEVMRDDTQELQEIRKIAKDELKNEPEKQKISDMFERMFEDKIYERRNIARQKLADENSTLVDRKRWMEEIREMDRDITGKLAEPGYVSVPNSKGEMEIWEVDPVVADIYKYSVRQRDMNKAERFFNETSKIFRLGTTGLNLMSFVNQSFRDFGNLWLTSGSYHMVNLSRAEMRNLLGPEIANWYMREEPEVYKQLLELAERRGKSVESMAVERELAIGRQTSTQATETAFLKTVGDTRTMEKVSKNELSMTNTALDRAVDILSTPNEMRERAFRNIVYSDSLNQALQRGYTLKQARVQAEFMMNNATTNFSRQMVHLRSMQRTVPYLGAAVNGAKSFYRILSVDPVGVMSRFVGGFVIPVMAFTGMALNDPVARKKYEQLSEYEKDNNIIIPMNGTLLKIPIPQEIGPLVKPWQHLVEKMYDANRHDFWELMLNDALGVSPLEIGGFYDLDQDAMENPTIWERLDNGATQLVWGQMATPVAKAIYMSITGKDPYTGKFIDTSYQYYDSETGEVVTMDSNTSAFAQAMADAFGGPAGVIAAVVNSLVGRTGMDVLDSITSAIQYGTSGGEEGSLTTILERAGQAISKPITVAEYDRTKTAWNRQISSLYREKERILNSSKYKEIEQAINTETNPDKLKKLKAQRQDMLEGWYEKTKVAINKLQDNYGGTIDRYRMASLISLLNMHDNTGGISAVGRAANDDLYYEGRNEAIRTLISMGADTTGDGSILGYMTTIKNRDGTESVGVKFYKPLEILAMQNAWYNNASVSKAYVQELLEDGPINYTQELKQVKKLRQQIYDKGKLTQADYSNINALELEWNARVMSAIAPYVERVSPESAINDEEVMEYLDNLILLPSEFKKDKNGRYVTDKKLGEGSSKDAYIKNYIRKIFEVNNSGYSTGRNYSGRQNLGGQ